MPNNDSPFILPSMNMLHEILILEDKTGIQTNPSLGLPFRLDGKVYAPNDIHLFDQRLYFYLNDMLIEAKQLKAFASKSDLRHYLMDTEQLSVDFEQSLEIGQSNQDQTEHIVPARMYTLRDFSGPHLDLPLRHALLDANQVFCPDNVHSNYIIDSITSTARALACFSSPNLKGNMLIIARNTHLPDVSTFWPINITSVVEIG